MNSEEPNTTNMDMHTASLGGNHYGGPTNCPSDRKQSSATQNGSGEPQYKPNLNEVTDYNHNYDVEML